MFWQIASPPSRRIVASALLLTDEERVLEQRLPGWEVVVFVEWSVRRLFGVREAVENGSNI